MRRANDSPRRIGIHLARNHALQQQTFKLPTMIRPIGVNPATAAIERDARLRKFQLRLTRLCFGRHRQTERFQTSRIIPGHQLHGGKDLAVATKAALEAERIGTGQGHASSRVYTMEAAAENPKYEIRKKSEDRIPKSP